MYVGYGDPSLSVDHTTRRSSKSQESSGSETASKEADRGCLGQLTERTDGYCSQLLIPPPPDEDHGINNSLSTKQRNAAQITQFKSLEDAFNEENSGLCSNIRSYNHVQLQEFLSHSPDQNDATILSEPQRRGTAEKSYCASNLLLDPNKRSKAHLKQRRRRVQESEGFQNETILQKSNQHSLSLKTAILSPSRSPGIIFLSKKSPPVYPSPARSPIPKGCGFWIGEGARKLCESRASRFSEKTKKISKFNANRHGIQSPVLKGAISCLLSHETEDNKCGRSVDECSSSPPSCLGFLRVRKTDRFLTCSSTSQQLGQVNRKNRENDCTDNDRINRSLWAYRGSTISSKLCDKLFGSSSRKIMIEAESESSATISKALPHKVTNFSPMKIFRRNGQDTLDVNRVQNIERKKSKHKFQNTSSNLAYVGSLFSLRKEINVKKRTADQNRKWTSTSHPQSTLWSPNEGLIEGSNVSNVADLPLHVNCIRNDTFATVIANHASSPQESYVTQNQCFNLEMDSHREEAITPTYNLRISSDNQCHHSACVVMDKIFSVDVCHDRAGKCDVSDQMMLRMEELKKENTSNFTSIEAIQDPNKRKSMSRLDSDQGSEEDLGVSCLFRLREENAPTLQGISHGCVQIISCTTDNHQSDNSTEVEKIYNASCSPMSNKSTEDGICSHFGNQGVTANMAMQRSLGLEDMTEEQASSSPRNVKVVFEQVQSKENSVTATPMSVTDDTQQQSPVSVLDATFEHASATSVEEETDDDTPEQSCLANFQEAKRQLLEKLQVYERLATMDFSALQDYVNQNHDDDDDSIMTDVSIEEKDSCPNISYHVNPMWEDSDDETEQEKEEEEHVPAISGPTKVTCTQSNSIAPKAAHSLNLSRWETSSTPLLKAATTTTLKSPAATPTTTRPTEPAVYALDAFTIPHDFFFINTTPVQDIGEEVECLIFTSLTEELALELSLSLSLRS